MSMHFVTAGALIYYYNPEYTYDENLFSLYDALRHCCSDITCEVHLYVTVEYNKEKMRFTKSRHIYVLPELYIQQINSLFNTLKKYRKRSKTECDFSITASAVYTGHKPFVTIEKFDNITASTSDSDMKNIIDMIHSGTKSEEEMKDYIVETYGHETYEAIRGE